MAKVKKNPYTVKGMTVVTPKGEAEWCKCLKHQLDTTFNPLGEYSTNILFDPKDPKFKAFEAKINAMVDKAFEQAMNDEGELKLTASKKKALQAVYPFKEHILKKKDEDGEYSIEEETGKVMLKLKLKDVENKKAGNDYVKIIGAGNKELNHEDLPEIGDGSIIQAKLYVFPYYMASSNTIGVSNILKAVKVIDLIAYEPDGEDFEDDEGYTPEGNSEEEFEDTEEEEEEANGDF